jgi:trimeric autotransporter adhesin
MKNRLAIIPGVMIMILMTTAVTPYQLVVAPGNPQALPPGAPGSLVNTWTPVGTGLSGNVYTVALAGYDLYVGGDFTIAGDPAINDLARWDGSTWHALGSGVSGGIVKAITIEGRNVYVGGQFTSAGTSIPNTAYLARWDALSESWSAVGSGVDNIINTIAVEGADIYVGGNLQNAGGVSTPFIARWDGNNWNALSSSQDLTGSVNSIAIAGTAVIVGGAFDGMSGGINYITLWNGSDWNAMGILNGFVNAVQVVGSDVFAAGNFTSTDSVPGTSHIARWDRISSSWHALGNGLPGNIKTLAVAGGAFYAGGDFTDPTGSLEHIARWDGIAWRPLGVGLNASVWSIALDGPHVYAGGEFTDASGDLDHIARWDAGDSDPQWNNLDDGLSSNVWDIVPVGSDIYMAGFFNNAGGSGANFITRWDGSNWHNLGTNKNNAMRAAAVEGPNLYVGGNFTDAIGNQDYIARWDMLTSSWNALGSGLPGEVDDLVATGPHVYAGGVFTDAEAGYLDHIAHFNGSSWQPLDEGLNGNVYALAIAGPDVYVGGAFTNAGGSGANYIARWDTRTSTWYPVGNGLNNTVYSILVSGPLLCVGGSFTSAGGNPLTRYITCLDNGGWVNMDTLTMGRVNAIALSAGLLYTGSNGPNYIQAWDGSTWTTVGGGLPGSVYALGVSGPDLYAGGSFNYSGGDPRNYIQRWGTDWHSSYLPVTIKP